MDGSSSVQVWSLPEGMPPPWSMPKAGTDLTTNTWVEPTTWIASAAKLPLVVW
jgi:hypothetical protein